ncbi:competence protein ComJ [Treponema sp.]|uniref:competence protein ComJ n=1 Tax=Treponema sp. TaxID=166 RepID=UPI00388F695A
MVELELSYKQFCIFNETVNNPFNDWSEVNVAQGFSIREDSISVMTLNNDGILKISVSTDSKIIDDANRIIEFEYQVKDENVSVATISNEMKIQIKKGLYKIRVQLCKESDESEICYLSFLKKDSTDRLPRYLKIDNEITKSDNFELDSNPA